MYNTTKLTHHAFLAVLIRVSFGGMTTQLPELVGISYSPWTEKARWALDYCQVPYSYSEHTILLSMPKLSKRLKKPGKEITIPLLIAENGPILDSFEIALFADAHKNNPDQSPLFPADQLYEIKHLNMLCETVLDATRALVIQNILKNPQALQDSLPRAIPRFVRPPLKFMARLGTRYISKAFEVEEKSEAAHRLALTQGIFLLDRAWKKAGSRFMAGDHFTYADILLATTLQGVAPVKDTFISLTPALREVWSQPELAREMQDLTTWRDELYLRYRA